MPAIDPSLFRDTMRDELRSAWLTLRDRHRDDRFYAFGFYTSELASDLMVTASTEEGLSAVTGRYVAKLHRDPALTRASLRWSPCDSPLHIEGSDLLPRSSELRNAGPDPYDDTPEADQAVALVFHTAVEALQQLDRDGAFGRDAEREQLVLGVWKGDQSDEERIEFARQLNPKPVVQRFVRELTAARKAFRAIY